MGFQLSNADDGSWRVRTPRASQVVFHVTTLRRPTSKVKASLREASSPLFDLFRLEHC